MAKEAPAEKPAKRVRKPSPFLRALRRAELLIEDLPREMAIKVAEHALFIARSLPEIVSVTVLGPISGNGEHNG